MKLKITFSLVYLFFVFGCSSAFSSSARDYFRSKRSGNFSALGTWESSADNLNWVTATLSPTATSKGITIKSSHLVLFNTSLALDDLSIESGGTLQVNPGILLNIINGPASIDCEVSGTISNYGLIKASGILTFLNGGRYQHQYETTPGSIPQAQWEDGSDCQILGYTTSNSGPAFFNDIQNFYNFTWDCKNQAISSMPSLINRLNVRNDFNVISTGMGFLRLFYENRSVDHAVGNYLQTGGIVDMLYSASKSNLYTRLNVSGNFDISNGVFRKTNIDVTNKTTVIFTSGGTSIFTNTAGSFLGEINFIVNPNVTVNFGNSIISGNSGTFTAELGATLITANSGGFALTGATGTVQSTGTRTYSSAANYTYNGTTQNTGTGLPATVNNLTIDNNSAVNLRPGDLNVTGALAITTGSLDLGTNLLTTPGTTGFTGAGTLFTQNTSATPLTTGKTWGGTVAYNSASPQTIVNGNYNNLNGSGGNRTLGSSINIAGSFTPGTPSLYTTTNSTVNFNGTGAQNIPTFDFNNLSASNAGTKTVSGNASVLNTLAVNDAAVINANGNLTLLASVNKNANVAPITGAADIIGNVKVQSYLYGAPSGGIRGTKSMSSPINDAAVVGAKTFQQLKNDVITTGPGGTANGFDAGPTPIKNPVLLNFYNEAAPPTLTSFIPVPSIGTSTSPGTGFLFFYTGNRVGMYNNPGKMIAPFPAPEDMIVTYNGPINKGDINVNVGFTANSDAYDGFYLAGNPYPATIDWDAVVASSTNMGTTITVVTGGKSNATYNTVSPGFAVNGGSRYIQPGQGFYVQSLPGGGNLRFREAHKNLVNAPSRLLSTPTGPKVLNASFSTKKTLSDGKSTLSEPLASIRQLRVKLNSGEFEEETAVVFKDGFAATADGKDSRYFTGYDVNLATLSADNQTMAINLMPDVNTVDDVKLSVNAKKTGDASLTFNGVDLGESKVLLLEDRYLDKLVEVENGTVYNFNLNKAVAASFGDNRFKLLLNPPKTLPIILTDFKVKKTSKGVSLIWNTQREQNNKGFEIERADDLTGNFVNIAFVEAKTNPQELNTYSAEDQHPLIGNNYYRLKQMDTDGKFKYSEVKVVSFDLNNNEESLSVYPNPTADVININLATSYNGALSLNILDANGKFIKQSNFKNGERIIENVAEIPAGIYMVEIRGAEGEVLGVNKLIKK